jgi:hypothetical protein
MTKRPKENHLAFLVTVGLLAWVIPGGGHFVLKERKRSIIIFTTIVLTLCTGLYVGSIGVVNLAGDSAFYVKAAQVMNPPIVFALAWRTAGGDFPVYSWPNEIGQIYTMTSGLLNLLCVVNAVYLAYLRRTEPVGERNVA